MTAMRYLTVLFLAAGLTARADPSAAVAVPQVRTADLASLLQGAHTPVQVTARPGENVPAPSINAELVDWHGEQGAELARIAALAPIDLQSNGNDLRTVLRAICEGAQMHDFIVADDPVMTSPVTLSGVRHPWEFLRTLAQTYNLDIVYKNGLWNIYPLDSGELIAKSYVLKHNTLEHFKASGGSGGGGESQAGGNQTASGNGSGASGSISPGGGSGGSGGAGGSSPSIDRASQSVFQVDSKAITTEVQNFIGLSLGDHAVVVPEGGTAGMAGPRLAPRPNAAGAKGLVSFLSDTNTLYVVATRAQHEMLKAWLADLDQPIKEIYIETKFLLTSVNPSSHLGLSNPLLTTNGVGAKLSGLSATIDPRHLANYQFPSAIFSADDLTARLNLLNSDSRTSTVQYPMQTTLSGREVVLMSVKQVPIVSSVNQNNSGGATNTTSSIQFVDVGTKVAILPKVLNDRDVLLNISITVSSITDTVTINGNPYPVVANQTYNQQVMVESGYSLALGGLEQTLQTDQTSKLPLLGDIPFFGFAFRETQKNREHSVLTMIVTPAILPGYNGGNTSGTAQYGTPSQNLPPRTPLAAAAGAGIEDVQRSLRGFDRDIDTIAAAVKEGRSNRHDHVRAQLLLNELDLMGVVLKRERVHGEAAPAIEDEIAGYRRRLQRLNHQISNDAPLG
ncbi:MAG: hypothetical protein PHE83_14890 [Opitutaceae bacterium]|nr:hypothetical protein [Opitutaceae bacterium]